MTNVNVWLGVHMDKIFYGLIFKCHSLGGSSIACLWVSKKCAVAFACAKRATRWALPRFLVLVLVIIIALRRTRNLAIIL